MPNPDPDPQKTALAIARICRTGFMSQVSFAGVPAVTGELTEIPGGGTFQVTMGGVIVTITAGVRPDLETGPAYTGRHGREPSADADGAGLSRELIGHMTCPGGT